MYLPNLIPKDLHVDWANPSTNLNQQIKSNKGNSGIPNNRKSEFPPLSYYTPSKATPVHMNSSSKKIYSSLKKYRSNLNKQGLADFEGLEHISLELGSRINSLNENETWGYRWIKPLGVNKTMIQLIEECKQDDSSRGGSINTEVQLNQGASNSSQEVHDETQNNTHLMTENYGHLQPGELANDNTTSLNNNITIETSNQTEPEMNRNILIGEIETERDMDAELSNHDLNADSSDSNDSDEYDNAFYEDGDDMNDMEDDVDDDNEEYNNAEVSNYGTANAVSSDPVDNDDESVRNSFDQGLMNILDIGKRKIPKGEDEYFMAYEDYQDDHSIIEGHSTNARVVSISESVQTRGSIRSDRHNYSNLTTPSTFQSATIQQTTGNTSIDERNVIYTSDFDMTLE